MSDREYEDILRDREFEEFIRGFERDIAKRPLTPDELAAFKRDYKPLSCMQLGPDSEPWKWTMMWRDLAQRLKSRQGSVLPDFEQLYRRKAELDGQP